MTRSRLFLGFGHIQYHSDRQTPPAVPPAGAGQFQFNNAAQSGLIPLLEDI